MEPPVDPPGTVTLTYPVTCDRCLGVIPGGDDVALHGDAPRHPFDCLADEEMALEYAAGYFADDGTLIVEGWTRAPGSDPIDLIVRSLNSMWGGRRTWFPVSRPVGSWAVVE